MSDELAAQMNKNIVKRVRYWVCATTIMLLVAIWSDLLTPLVETGIWGTVHQATVVLRIVQSTLAVVAAVAIAIVTVSRDVDLHNWIDNHLWKVRVSTGRIICQEMVDAAMSVRASNWMNMKGKDKEIMNLFYHFVNEQTVLRPLAFTYWEQYFVNLHVICLTCVGAVCAFTIELWRRHIGVGIIVALIFAAICTLYTLTTRYNLVKKMQELPVQQIGEIKNSQARELKTEVENRFGNVILH